MRSVPMGDYRGRNIFFFFIFIFLFIFIGFFGFFRKPLGFLNIRWVFRKTARFSGTSSTSPVCSISLTGFCIFFRISVNLRFHKRKRHHSCSAQSIWNLSSRAISQQCFYKHPCFHVGQQRKLVNPLCVNQESFHALSSFRNFNRSQRRLSSGIP